jgi:hypothetical protein
VTADTEGQTRDQADQADSPVVISKRASEALTEALMGVPPTGDDGYERLLLQLAGASDPSQLDAPWRAEGMRAYINEPLEVRGLRRIESDYEGGLPFFLVVDAASIATGELVTFTTGSVTVVAQLAKANQLGAIPGWRVIPRQADRPSERGFYPQHLEVMRGRLASER